MHMKKPLVKKALAMSLLAAVLTVASAGAFALDSDRVDGTGKQITGSVEEKAGQVTGDKDLQAKGQDEKSEGELQDAWGKVKDAAREFGQSIESKFSSK